MPATTYHVMTSSVVSAPSRRPSAPHSFLILRHAVKVASQARLYSFALIVVDSPFEDEGRAGRSPRRRRNSDWGFANAANPVISLEKTVLGETGANPVRGLDVRSWISLFGNWFKIFRRWIRKWS